ncbi:MAG TPA: FGGY family carbohydrate kinase [Anaerolineales bacterium]|nr:FGGY family carbohydrate kinase [Anaerolineales bacterium]
MKDLSPLVLGLDCSTTACKAIVWDCRGRSIANGYSSLALLTPQPAWHEQPAESWWVSMTHAIRQAMTQVKGNQLKALCIAHQRETFVPLDKHDRPLMNGIVWMDERARELLPVLEQTLGQENFHRLTGKRLSVNLTIAKIAWLRQQRPDVFAQTRKYLDVHTFLVHRLTGLYHTGWGCADPTGLFDIQNNCWAESLLDQVHIRIEQLPEIFPPGTIVGYVTPVAAEACGLPVGLPVVAGIGDGQASSLGVDSTSPGDACLSLGTSVISGTFSDAYIFDPAFRTMTGGIPGSYLLETVQLGGGYTLAWFIEKIASQPGQDVAQLRSFYDQAASAVPPGSNGLVAVPYWNSVLGPYWDPFASGIIVGWRGFHELPHLYRAILEGVAFEQYLGTLGVEKALGQPVQRYIAIGGGAQSDLWCQIIADITNKPVFRAATTEAAALGAGILAATAVGCYANAREAAQEMTHILPQPIEPNALGHAFYNRLFEEVYRPLFPALQLYLDRLAAISNPGEQKSRSGCYNG